MTIWAPHLVGRRGPFYQIIADALAEDIRDGRLEEGQRLPTHRDLAYRLGVTVGTVTRAYAEAERKGLVAGHVGRGTFVRTPATLSGIGAPNAPGQTLRRPARKAAIGESPLERLFLYAGQSAAGHRFDFSLNYSVGGGFASLLGPGLERMLRDPARLDAVARYQSPVGMADHRCAASEWLARTGVVADPDQIVITAGCQSAILTTFLALAEPGDVVLAEELTWPGLRETALALGLHVHAVAMDADGLDPDALERACRDLAPRILYTIPTLHNPTTGVMPEERRRTVARIAERYGVFTVEDDVYGFALEDAPDPIRAFAPRMGLYITSLSKSGCPGLRIGYLVAAPELHAKLEGAMRTNMLMTSSVAAELATLLIRGGEMDAATAMQRREARARQALAVRHLDGIDVRTHPAAFHCWVRVPSAMSGDEFIGRLLRQGVAVTPGDAFSGGEDRSLGGRHVRVCLGCMDRREDVAEGLSVIARVARDAGTPSMPLI